MIERQGDGWGAYCPDLPGLGVVGESRMEVERLVRETITLHVANLRAAGEPVPTPSAVAGVSVRVPE